LEYFPVDNARVIYTLGARYLYIKRNVEKVWVIYTLGARYLYIKRNVEKVRGVRYVPENTVLPSAASFSMMMQHP
jgi:hypothetical protein